MALQEWKPPRGHTSKKDAIPSGSGERDHEAPLHPIRILINEAQARQQVLDSLDDEQLKKALGFTGASDPGLFNLAIAYARGEIS